MTQLANILSTQEPAVLEEWVRYQRDSKSLRGNLIKEAEVRDQSSRFLEQFRAALSSAAGENIEGPGWASVRAVLNDISRNRALKGFTPTETASFIFSLKHALFAQLRTAFADQPKLLADELWNADRILDALGLYTTEVYQKSREEVIARQQQELLELSTPVVELWEGILAVPLIGTLDSSRTQVVMENLLQRIVDTGAALAIIDITGVPTVDTLVAQHLLKTVSAARLMGADCIISGIRPQIAQTIVHLGVDLGEVITKATLGDAFRVALRRTGFRTVRDSGGSSNAAVR
ncbi:MAG TPA: STAS domain-containing protein [Burkholderiales bacterium]|nr:STAS domain-containing protein [Burkholderiales bacterium]